MSGSHGEAEVRPLAFIERLAFRAVLDQGDEGTAGLR